MFTWCDVNANAGDRNIVKIKKKSKCRKSSGGRAFRKCTLYCLFSFPLICPINQKGLKWRRAEHSNKNETKNEKREQE